MRIGPIEPQHDLWNQYLRMVLPHDRTTEVLQAASLPSPLVPWGTVVSDIFLAISSVMIVLAVLWLVWQTVSSIVTTAWSGEAIARDWHSIWGPLRIVAGLTFIMPVANGNNLAQLAVIQISSWSGQVANTIYIATLRAMSQPLTNAQMVYTDAHLSMVLRGLAVIEMCNRSVHNFTHRENLWQGGSLSREQRGARASRHPGQLAVISSPDTPHTGVDGSVRFQQDNNGVTIARYALCPHMSLHIARPPTSGAQSRAYDSTRRLWMETLQGIHRDLIPIVNHLFLGTFPNGAAVASLYHDSPITDPQEAYAQWEARSLQRMRELSSRITEAVREAWGAANAEQQRHAERLGWLYISTLLWQRTGMMRDAWVLTNTLPQINGLDTFARNIEDQQNQGAYRRFVEMVRILGPDLFVSNIPSSHMIGVSSSPREGTATGNYATDTLRSVMLGLGILPSIDIMRGSPMMQLADWGFFLMERGAVIWAMGAGGNLVTSNIPIMGLLSVFGNAASSVASMLGGVMILVGALHGYVLPALPMIVFVIFALSCIVLMVEALIAAPIWALGHIKLSGQQMIDTTQLPGYHILFSLFIRIPIAVIAYVFSLLLSDVGIAAVYQVVAPNFGGSASSLGPIGIVVFLLVVGYISWQVCIRAFSMISDLPDRVLRWINVQSPAPGDDGQRGVTGIAVMGMQRAGGINAAALGAMRGVRPIGTGQLPLPGPASKMPRR